MANIQEFLFLFWEGLKLRQDLPSGILGRAMVSFLLDGGIRAGHCL